MELGGGTGTEYDGIDGENVNFSLNFGWLVDGRLMVGSSICGGLALGS